MLVLVKPEILQKSNLIILTSFLDSNNYLLNGQTSCVELFIRHGPTECFVSTGRVRTSPFFTFLLHWTTHGTIRHSLLSFYCFVQRGLFICFLNPEMCFISFHCLCAAVTKLSCTSLCWNTNIK